MIEMIIKSSLEVVDRTERLIDAARRLLGVGLDEVEAYRLHVEIEKLTDVVLAMDEAARLLRRTFELRPEIARYSVVNSTVH
ncbi:hypothetical protein ELI38_27685 (plasmid) [Rhizobium leguminosarum]|jgi:hypothetical protein|uniref:Phosphate transport system regulatory protein PhoU n=1 Tax=Rhizobium leguminosarum bv. viciae TaxID=387 RepID=A0A2L1CND2_RHILV|nr:hypothetical protein [Rhizobium leguminosarum]MDH6662111.1 hypothetical protein [Rhizobium sophorae]AVC46239.1 hypothetical protein RLV_0319 [Rhizobium leguminosarum bv. viciae]MBB4525014.1 hypothetical protein [Rhizobium leguminosarum]MBP2490971.1 hypothetical protein [Rhizobium leguminosarum]MBY5463987.1 hypothetical protein [Rhizobium leguminosarum]